MELISFAGYKRWTCLVRKHTGAASAKRAPEAVKRRHEMLRWALGFFLIAIVAAIFGFGGIAVAAAGIAKILFFLFLILFLLALVGGLVRRV